MYIAPVDAGIDDAEWRSFVLSQGFGHLLAAGRNRDVPVAVPTQFVLDDRTVLLHLLARNPIFDAIEEQPRVLLAVAGDWAFVPSTWKTVDGEDPALGIPTTYYAAVQLIGTASRVDDPSDVAEILRTQLAALQPGVEVADPLAAHPERIRTIRGIRMVVDEVRAKFKYGGNVDEEHRYVVVDHLRARHGPGDRAAVDHTLRRLGAREARPSRRP